jgi:nucleoside-diphosphate-sugar epimerase
LLSEKNGEAYNVGNPECEISIIEFAQQLIELFPSKQLKLVRSEINNNYLKSDVSRNCPNISKINQLGWFPKTKLKEGLYRTVLSYE